MGSITVVAEKTSRPYQKKFSKLVFATNPPSLEDPTNPPSIEDPTNPPSLEDPTYP